jgi:hypothetical protein
MMCHHYFRQFLVVKKNYWTVHKIISFKVPIRQHLLSEISYDCNDRHNHSGRNVVRGYKK